MNNSNFLSDAEMSRLCNPYHTSTKDCQKIWLQNLNEVEMQVRSKFHSLAEALKRREAELCQKINECRLKVTSAQKQDFQHNMTLMCYPIMFSMSREMRFVDDGACLEKEIQCFGSLRMEQKFQNCNSIENEVPSSSSSCLTNAEMPSSSESAASSEESFNFIGCSGAVDATSKTKEVFGISSSCPINIKMPGTFSESAASSMESFDVVNASDDAETPFKLVVEPTIERLQAPPSVPETSQGFVHKRTSARDLIYQAVPPTPIPANIVWHPSPPAVTPAEALKSQLEPLFFRWGADSSTADNRFSPSTLIREKFLREKYLCDSEPEKWLAVT